jgi:hypothetical protein
MANFLRQNWLIDRRHVLRGLGVRAGPAVGSTACNRCSQPTKWFALVAACFIYLPNGVNTQDYQMVTAGRDYQMSRPLQVLEKHRDILTPLSGLYHPHGLGHHHNCSTIWLTAGKIGQSERIRSRSISSSPR